MFELFFFQNQCAPYFLKVVGIFYMWTQQLLIQTTANWECLQEKFTDFAFLDISPYIRHCNRDLYVIYTTLDFILKISLQMT